MHYVNVEALGFEELKKPGAYRVKVKDLIGEGSGASKFYLRYYLVEKGGHTPLDQHPYEHEVYVLKGHGMLRYSTSGTPATKEIREGDAIYIAPNEVHQFINASDEPLVFLCVKGEPELYGEMGK